MSTEAGAVTLNAFSYPVRRSVRQAAYRETVTGHGAHNCIRIHGWSVLRFLSLRPDWSIQTKNSEALLRGG